jgi:uncharacterized membrane protein YecN with MAPEG domain
MQLTVTAIYAGVLALIILALGINVTLNRIKLRISLGDGGNPQMLRMIRLHANAVEYIPIALLLMAIYEINGGSHAGLHIIGIALVAARLLQTGAMWSSDIAGAGRKIGQAVTTLSIAALALLNLAKTL